MSAQFIAASSQYLSNTSPVVTTYPFTVGMWFKPASLGVNLIWYLSNVGDTAFFRFYVDSTPQLVVDTLDGGTLKAIAFTSGVAAGSWYFVVARYISTTNRKASLLLPTGVIAHGSNTTSSNPVVTKLDIGRQTSGSFYDGLMAEYWITNADVQGDGAQLQESTIRQLAYGGPFSFPHLRKNLVEYHSFRSHVTSDSFVDKEEDLIPILGETITNTGGVSIGEHPPLPYWYTKATDHTVPFLV